MFKVDGWITYTAALIPLVMNGDKTLTSRVMRPQYAGAVYWKSPAGMFFRDEKPAHRTMIECPYGQPGAILGIKEGYRILHDIPRGGFVTGEYLADDAHFEIELSKPEWDKWSARKFPYRATAGRFMYRSLCRTRTLVKSIRAERLQDIIEAQAIAEGCDSVLTFSSLWDTINKARNFEWMTNPWVWRISFERIENGREEMS